MPGTGLPDTLMFQGDVNYLGFLGQVWDTLTPEAQLLEVDIRRALQGESLYPCKGQVELMVSQEGVANCILWWWEAQLDEHETISNKPQSRLTASRLACCAVFR